MLVCSLSGAGRRSRSVLRHANLTAFETNRGFRCGLLLKIEETRLRLREIDKFHASLYPRLNQDGKAVTCSDFRKTYGSLEPSQRSCEAVKVRGKITTIRSAGSKLFFLDILQGSSKVQVLCDHRTLSDSLDHIEFRRCLQSLQRGDFIEVEGYPERTAISKKTNTGELSIRSLRVPSLLAPSLHTLPKSLEDTETKIRKRHVDFHLNPKLKDTIVFRSKLINFVREFLRNDGQLEVQTPILSGSAGGAIARPFKTSATEFPDKKMQLRIAPELWLKRLIVGGFESVFEIGPSFRNEGLDPTHNPEFTTCEFYRAYTDLEGLLYLTEDLLHGVHKLATETKTNEALHIDVPNRSFRGPYKRLDFTTEIETAANCQLPDLASSEARDAVASILSARSIEYSPTHTLPQLLDRLAAYFLEPQCQEPTWITNHPECLSPLAKSFLHPDNGQMVAARGELFVNGREIINTYEEENSPVEQRRKFVQQLQFRDEENNTEVDENYLEALEWGMPPTGGWGCGIDRLCMLMTGSSRISDVQAFGSLRNVVGLTN